MQTTIIRNASSLTDSAIIAAAAMPAYFGEDEPGIMTGKVNGDRLIVTGFYETDSAPSAVILSEMAEEVIIKIGL